MALMTTRSGAPLQCFKSFEKRIPLNRRCRHCNDSWCMNLDASDNLDSCFVFLVSFLLLDTRWSSAWINFIIPRKLTDMLNSPKPRCKIFYVAGGVVRRCSSSPRDLELYDFQSLETSLTPRQRTTGFVESGVTSPLSPLRSFTPSFTWLPILDIKLIYHSQQIPSHYNSRNLSPVAKSILPSYSYSTQPPHLGRLSTPAFRGILQALPGVASATWSAISPWSIANSPSINFTLSIALSYLFLGRAILLSVGEDSSDRPGWDWAKQMRCFVTFQLRHMIRLWLAPFPLVFCPLTFSCWFPIPKSGCIALNERWRWSIRVLCRFLSTPPGLICGHMQDGGAANGLDCASFGNWQSFTHPPRWNHFVVFVWTTIVRVLFISTDSIPINQSISREIKTRPTTLTTAQTSTCKYMSLTPLWSIALICINGLTVSAILSQYYFRCNALMTDKPT